MRVLPLLLLLAACPGPPDDSGCDDGDGDGFCDDLDECDGDGLSDLDDDGVCDGEDTCFGDDASGDHDEDGVCDDLDPPDLGPCEGEDADGDGVCDDDDACLGDDAFGDADDDGVCDDIDPCLGAVQVDADEDGVCDDIDACAGDDTSGDLDADGLCDDVDLCFGGVEADADSDGLCDDLDLCFGGNAAGDSDTDGICDDLDVCVGYPWCLEITVDVTTSETGSALDGLLDESLFVRLGLPDTWRPGSGFVYDEPEVLELDGSSPAALAWVEELSNANVTLFPNGDIDLNLLEVPSCPNDQSVLSLDGNTDWELSGDNGVVVAGTWTLDADLQRYTTANGCAGPTDAVSGTAELTAIDGTVLP